jgi:hypothetical protein
MFSRRLSAQGCGAGAGRHANLQVPSLLHATLARVVVRGTPDAQLLMPHWRAQERSSRLCAVSDSGRMVDLALEHGLPDGVSTVDWRMPANTVRGTNP